MTSINKVILLDARHFGGAVSYSDLLEDKILKGRVAKQALCALEMFARVFSYPVIDPAIEEDRDNAQTARQRAAQKLLAALRALRKSGLTLKALVRRHAIAACRYPRLWAYARVYAFFHGRKVDARNLP